MKKTGSEMPFTDDDSLPGDSAPAEVVERARLQADVAEQRVRIAKDELRRARKRLKEAKREAKRARKVATSARKDWKRARKHAKKDDPMAPKARPTPEAVARRKPKSKSRKSVRRSTNKRGSKARHPARARAARK